MFDAIAQATQPAPSQWASDIVYVVGSLLGAVGTFIGVIALWRGTKAQGTANVAEAKADSNSTRITNTALHTQKVDDRLTDVAFKAGQAMGTGTGNAGPLPGGLVGQNLNQTLTGSGFNPLAGSSLDKPKGT
jgi:hypothetical protein